MSTYKYEHISNTPETTFIGRFDSVLSHKNMPQRFTNTKSANLLSVKALCFHFPPPTIKQKIIKIFRSCTF